MSGYEDCISSLKTQHGTYQRFDVLVFHAGDFSTRGLHEYETFGQPVEGK